MWSLALVRHPHPLQSRLASQPCRRCALVGGARGWRRNLCGVVQCFARLIWASHSHRPLFGAPALVAPCGPPASIPKPPGCDFESPPAPFCGAGLAAAAPMLPPVSSRGCLGRVRVAPPSLLQPFADSSPQPCGMPLLPLRAILAP